MPVWRLFRELTNTDYVNSVAWSPNSKYVVSANLTSPPRIWDVDTGKMVRELSCSSNNSVAWSPNGRYIVTSGDNNHTSVRIWDINTGREFRQLRGHTYSVDFVAWSPNSKYISFCGSDFISRERIDGWDTVVCHYSIKVWDVDTGKMVKELAYSGGDSVAWSPNGKYIVSGGYDNVVRIWDVDTGRESGQLTGHTWRVSSVVWSPNSKYIVSSSQTTAPKPQIILWNADTGAEIRRLTVDTDHVKCVAWSPNSQYIASGGGGWTARIWDVDMGKQIAGLSRYYDNMLNSLAWSPNGKYIVSGSGRVMGGSLSIWKER